MMSPYSIYSNIIVFFFFCQLIRRYKWIHHQQVPSELDFILLLFCVRILFTLTYARNRFDEIIIKWITPSKEGISIYWPKNEWKSTTSMWYDWEGKGTLGMRTMMANDAISFHKWISVHSTNDQLYLKRWQTECIFGSFATDVNEHGAHTHTQHILHEQMLLNETAATIKPKKKKTILLYRFFCACVYFQTKEISLCL